MCESSSDGSALSPGLTGSLMGWWCAPPAPGWWRFSHFPWRVTVSTVMGYAWGIWTYFMPVWSLRHFAGKNSKLSLLLNKQYLWFPSYSSKLYKINKNNRNNHKSLPHNQPTKVLLKGTLVVCLSDMIPNFLFNCQCVPIKGDFWSWSSQDHRVTIKWFGQEGTIKII